MFSQNRYKGKNVIMYIKLKRKLIFTTKLVVTNSYKVGKTQVGDSFYIVLLRAEVSFVLMSNEISLLVNLLFYLIHSCVNFILCIYQKLL